MPGIPLAKTVVSHSPAASNKTLRLLEIIGKRRGNELFRNVAAVRSAYQGRNKPVARAEDHVKSLGIISFCKVHAV